jgi:hypothetical protein
MVNGYGSPIDDFAIILLFYDPTFSLSSCIKHSRHLSSGLVCMKMLLNEIINISHHRGDDYFREIFSNPIINWTAILIWLLGLVSCVFLRIVSWFEKTGQAGPFRTLVNRLFSCIIDQVGIPYLLFQMQ